MMNKLSFAALRASAARQWARMTLTLSLIVRALTGAVASLRRAGGHSPRSPHHRGHPSPLMRLWRAINAFNNWLAVHVTSVVGSMWCAYAFAALALYGLPRGPHVSPTQYVQWLSQTFIQLVLLSIIMVGAAVIGAQAEKRHHAVEARMERMEREHGEELKALHTLIAELHSHTRCDGHTTIERAPSVTAPALTTPPAATTASARRPRRGARSEEASA